MKEYTCLLVDDSPMMRQMVVFALARLKNIAITEADDQGLLAGAGSATHGNVQEPGLKPRKAQTGQALCCMSYR